MDKSQMLNKLISYYSNGNKAGFAKMLGIKPNTLSMWIKRNTFDSELVFAKCDGISAEWLMSGRGAMFQDGRVVVEEDDSQQRISALTAEVERLKAENERLNKIIDKMIKVK